MTQQSFGRRAIGFGNRLLRSLGCDTYHYFDNKKAFRFLSNIEAVNGPISQKHRSLCDEYAKDVFGKSYYAPWLYTYVATQGRFIEGWIPDNYYGRTVYPKAKGEFGALSKFKSLAPRILTAPEALFPSGISIINGVFLTTSGEVIPRENLAKVIFADGPKAVFKADGSAWGGGVKVVHADKFSIDQIPPVRAGVVQPYIQQHQSLADLGSPAAATIRLTTVIPPNQTPSIRSVFLRLGATDRDIVDTDSCYIPMDMKTGVAGTYGFDKDWRPIDRHPGSGIDFKGFQVPSYPQLCQAALNLHAKIPFVDCIGWDFCVDTDNNVKLFEWNGAHNSIKFGEATQGPCFTDMEWEKCGLTK